MLCKDKYRFTAILWLLIVSAAAVWLLIYLPKMNVSSNVLDMLPRAEQDAKVDKFVLHNLDTQIIVAFRGSDTQAVPLGEKLKAIPQVEDVLFRTSDVANATIELLEHYPLAFVNDQTLDRLKDSSHFVNWVLAQIYSPFASPSQVEISKDPLLLVRQALMDQNLYVAEENGCMSVRDKKSGIPWYIYFVTTKPALSTEEREKFIQSINKLKGEVLSLDKESEVAMQGSLFYSDYAASLTKRDLLQLGTTSVLALLALMFWVYRSVIPLFLYVVSVSVGCVAGLTATILVFHEIHAVTLVMCLSLVGISTDYTTYFVNSCRTRTADQTPRDVMKLLSPVLWHAVLTTVVAYGLLLIAPFPGLRQMAVFAGVGLLASCLTVVLWFPYLGRGIIRFPLPMEEFITCYLSEWKKKSFTVGLTGMAIALILVGLLRVTANDDLANLQKAPLVLTSQEQKISSLLNRNFSQEWLVISGDNDTEFLKRLDYFRNLANLSKRVSPIKAMLPPIRSIQVQIDAGHAAKDVFKIVSEKLKGLGFGDVSAPALAPLSWTEFLNTPLGRLYSKASLRTSEGWQLFLPISQDDKELLNGVEDLPGFSIVNRRAQMQNLLRQYREMVGELVVLVFILIITSFALRFGLRSSWPAVLNLCLALGAGVSVLGWIGWPVNLFSIFALILVLGIGIDYVVVFVNLRNRPTEVIFSLIVASTTTLISFGILIFSQIPAVQNFGLVLATGILTAFIFSPLVLWGKRK